MKTRITELFNIKYPIIQGGMQHVGRPRLVAAVSNAGGLGILTASSYKSKEDLLAAIKETKQLTKQPFGFNLSTSGAQEDIDRNLSIVIEEGIPVVETSGRNPGAIIEKLKKAGVKVFHKIPHVRFAKKLEEQGFDAIAVIGFEAGGHPGPFGVSSEIVTMEIVDAVKIPVIMGGGLYDGRGLLAALSYGAEGVLMGSRFVATAEAEVNDCFKQWMVGAASTDTLTLKSDNPNRVAKTKAAYEVLGHEFGGKTLDEIHKLMLGMKGRDAWESGDTDKYLHSIGQIIGLIKSVDTCEKVISDIVTQAKNILDNRLNKQF